MKIAYFDCFSGASGNMILGSLVDAGLPLDRLQAELRRLPVSGWDLVAQRVTKRGLAALYLDANVAGEDELKPHGGHGHHHEGIAHRTLADVLAILRQARFAPSVEGTAERIYRRLAAAEAAMHATTVDEVVFHEVGQIDAIIDIAGFAIALDLLGIERVYCSALPCGTGRITSAHGEGPSPAPATMELLRGFPTYAIDLAAELVTPTGAAILTAIASFEPRPPMIVREIGYGSGRSDFPFPNVLRVLVGETRAAQASDPGDDVVQVETNIDDMDPRVYEHAIERIFSSGALDVWTQAVGMKKNRPGVVLCALAPANREAAVALAMLSETTTIGLRSWRVHRTVLERESRTIATSLGDVRVKIVDAPGGRRARAEYEDCKRIAEQRGLPLADVMRQVEQDVAERLERS